MNTLFIQLHLPKFFIILIFSINLLVCSCKKYAAASPAFFIKAATAEVVITNTVQGSASSKISELFLYVNGKFQGAYPKGNIMPIVSNNTNVKIEVLAGIKNNGNKATRIPWLFYDKVQIDTLVQSGVTFTRNFNFKYNQNAKFAWVEGFENTTGQSIAKSSISSVSYSTITGADAFEGNTIKMQLSTVATIAQIESVNSFTLPSGSSNVYLELDYKCYQEFSVGLIAADGTPKQVFTLNASPNWNKTYINLADAINSAPTSYTHKVYFKMVKLYDTDDSQFFLDNIKVVHF